jgi:hypothetical protein
MIDCEGGHRMERRGCGVFPLISRLHLYLTEFLKCGIQAKSGKNQQKYDEKNTSRVGLYHNCIKHTA